MIPEAGELGDDELGDDGDEAEVSGDVGLVVGVSTITVVAGTVSPLVVTGPVSVVDVVVKVPDHGTVVVVMIPDGAELGLVVLDSEDVGELALFPGHTDTDGVGTLGQAVAAEP